MSGELELSSRFGELVSALLLVNDLPFLITDLYFSAE